jgi:hypothetical protein
LLRDLDDGPVRRATNSIASAYRSEAHPERGRDAELIARTFGFADDRLPDGPNPSLTEG